MKGDRQQSANWQWFSGIYYESDIYRGLLLGFSATEKLYSATCGSIRFIHADWINITQSTTQTNRKNT